MSCGRSPINDNAYNTAGEAVPGRRYVMGVLKQRNKGDRRGFHRGLPLWRGPEGNPQRNTLGRVGHENLSLFILKGAPIQSGHRRFLDVSYAGAHPQTVILTAEKETLLSEEAVAVYDADHVEVAHHDDQSNQHYEAHQMHQPLTLGRDALAPTHPLDSHEQQTAPV